LFTYLNKLLVDDGILAGDATQIRLNLIRYGVLALLQAVFVFAFIVLAGIVGEKVQLSLRQRLFSHLQKLSLSYYSVTPVGWIMSRVTSDVNRVANLLTWGVIDVSWGILNIIAATIFMLIINWRMALVVVFSIPILIVVAIKFRTSILKQYRQVRKQNSVITGQYNEMITGVRVIKALGREQGSLQEFRKESLTMYNSSYRAAVLSALFLPTIQLISSFILAGVVYYAGWQFDNLPGGITIGSIQAFMNYVTFMMWPIFDMARIFAEMQLAVASGERIFSLLDSVPAVQDAETAYDPGTIKGDIVFDNVTFWYDDDEEKLPVLKHFSLQVKQGETIALVGPTGGGKTTTVNLLARFYEPKEGEIRINGKNYHDYTLHGIHSRLGIVLQTPHLFSGTIMENIRYGRLDAADDEIIEAAKLAGAHQFISDLPKQYEEEVGEGGNLLSVGQKQLLSLARAILANPEIFIMDEATSSVDTMTEALIQKGMDRLLQSCTSFVIAHRLSTIKSADRILVIEDGQIQEMGTHAELIRKNGKYYQLYTKQFRQEKEAAYNLLTDEVAPVAAD
ncbi:MAG TPA: ABC transporter ATP-binding protein, partial [Chloroflexi bacterium]|nr:ABC transporter ATP-binding protein [Chloroflexota bacterium]